MTGDDRFDPLETELQRRFAELDHGREDPDAVLDAMRPRLHRARRTHRIVAVGAAVAALAVAVVVGLAALQGSGGGGSVHVPPATRSTEAPTRVPTTVTAPTPTGDGGAPEPSAPDGSIPTSGTAPDGATATTETANPDQSPESDTPYSSPGGSIVVRRSGGTIGLASSTLAAGFTEEVHEDGPTRVEVRFQNADNEWRIRVELVDGELRAETTQH